MLLDELTKTEKKILIIGPHPDDIEFSTGRLIMKRKGKNVFIIVMTDGRKGQDGSKTKRIIPEEQYAKIRKNESRKALKEFGVNEGNIYFLNLHDQEILSNPYIIDNIYLRIKKTSPDFILIPPWEGAHPDHDAAHLFALVAAKNAGFNIKKVIEYGSYNNYEGKLRVQEFIPFEDAEDFTLIPTPNEQKRWTDIMKIFRSQTSLHEKYIPVSHFERYRELPKYDYTKLPYSTEQAEIVRDLLSIIYPVARNIIPKKQKMFYETWKDNINPSKVKQKLNEYVKHYIMEHK
jgi:LmbE family N-acetylglucosaminyl deacetylase